MRALLDVNVLLAVLDADHATIPPRDRSAPVSAASGADERHLVAL